MGSFSSSLPPFANRHGSQASQAKNQKHNTLGYRRQKIAQPRRWENQKTRPNNFLPGFLESVVQDGSPATLAFRR